MPLVRWQKENEKMAKGTKKEKSKIYKDNYHVHFNQSAKLKGFKRSAFSAEDQGECKRIHCC